MKKLLFILTLILSGLLWYVMVPAAPTPSAGRPPLMESFSYPYLGKKLPRPLRLCYLAYHMKDVAKERIDKSDWVSLDNMPAYLPQALIATEDRRFYSHIGIDPSAIMRAVLVNLQYDEVAQGGSTLTQQLVKNNLLSPERSLERKLWEAGLALIVEARYSKEEILERINNNTITDILNKIEVKAGDVVMVKAGTIHAIGAGVFICEIQQNSNCTYRMYDYDRRDKFGNPRELHVKKALDVVDNHKYIKDNKTEVVIARNEHFTEERLVQCKYFEVYKYDVNDEAKITVDEASFVSVLFINGSGTIETDDYEKTMEFKAGDSFFVSAGLRSIIVKGQATMVVTRV